MKPRRPLLLQLRRHGPGIAVLLALLCLWEAVTRLGWVSAQVLPPASEVLQTGFSELLHGRLGTDALTTLVRLLTAFFFATLIATPLGILLGLSKSAFEALWPLIEFMRPMPVIAIMPIAIYFLGLGNKMSVTVTAIGAGWLILINTMDGIRAVDPVLIETGRTFHISKMRRLFTILLPAAAPQIFTGLRLGLGIAVIITVVVELASGFGGGLGAYISISSGSFALPGAYAGICLVGVLGYAVARLFLAVEQRVMGWHSGAKASSR
jgi:ABC-type nitrate/sulfonate/bicarbonate transport system permease component